MMDKLFDLRDKEFREYFTSNVCVGNYIFILKGEKISDKDLMLFYLKYNKVCDENSRDITRILFNYKIRRTSYKRLMYFEKIIKSKTGLSFLPVPIDHCRYHTLKSLIDNGPIFNELIDIFLDEI